MNKIPDYFQKLYETFTNEDYLVEFEPKFEKSNFGECLNVKVAPRSSDDFSRLVHICKNSDDTWNPVSDGIFLKERYSTSELIKYVKNRMVCSYEECEEDFNRRIKLIKSNENV